MNKMRKSDRIARLLDKNGTKYKRFNNGNDTIFIFNDIDLNTNQIICDDDKNQFTVIRYIPEKFTSINILDIINDLNI